MRGAVGARGGVFPALTERSTHKHNRIAGSLGTVTKLGVTLRLAKRGASASTGCHVLLLTHLYDEIVHEQTRRVAHQNSTGRIDIARPGLTVEL